MATNARHGKNGRVKIGSATLKITEWRGTHRVEPVEATDTESNGFQEMSDTGGIESLNGSATAILLSGAPPDAVAGTKYDTELYPGDKTATSPWEFNAFVSDLEMQNVVRSGDPLTYTFNFMSSGPITKPTT